MDCNLFDFLERRFLGGVYKKGFEFDFNIYKLFKVFVRQNYYNMYGIIVQENRYRVLLINIFDFFFW